MENEILKIEQLNIGYKTAKRLLKSGFDAKAREGELICILGANGTGKSTLIKTMAGLLPARTGSVMIDGENINTMSIDVLARKRSIVLTDRILLGNTSVYELVAMGRSPYTGLMGQLSEADHHHIKKSLNATDAASLAEREISRLSDGEMQKVLVARALAQDTLLMLMDEPTAHLDLPNRIHIMRLLKKLVRENHKTIIMSTHELDLALQAADKIWIFNELEIIKGTPGEMVSESVIQDVFGSEEVQFDPLTYAFKMPDY